MYQLLKYHVPGTHVPGTNLPGTNLPGTQVHQSNLRQHMHHSRPLSMSSGELEQREILRGTSTGPCWRGIHDDDHVDHDHDHGDYYDDYYDDGDHDHGGKLEQLIILRGMSKEQGFLMIRSTITWCVGR